MNKILIIYILLLTSIAMSAQELSVKSFEAIVNDLSARTHPRNDNNGNGCALIKVLLAASGAVFEGNVMGDVAYKTNEYWVYMPAGSKRLKVKHPSYIPLDVTFGDYGVTQLEGKVTYKLTLLMPSGGQSVVTPVITNQFVVFQLEPKEAVVEINDEQLEVNDGVASKYVKFGNYRYVVRSKDYHPTEGIVNVNDADNKVVVNVTLKPAFGYLTFPNIQSLKGASLYVDDEFISKLPLANKLKLKSGGHVVKISQQLYKPFQTNITVKDAQTFTCTPQLVDNSRTVTISVGNNADILVDNQKKGQGTWTGKLSLGVHMIEAQKKGYQPSKTSIELAEGSGIRTITLEDPKPIYGIVKITSTPAMATAFLDGKNVGTTPLQLTKVLIGEHRLEFKKDGYKTIDKNIMVKENGVTEIAQNLQKSVGSYGKGYDEEGIVLRAIETVAEPEPPRAESAIDYKVFDVVEQMPSFPGGQAAMMQYLDTHRKYPAVAEENGIQGRVTVQFVVERDGSLTDVKTMKSVDPSLDKEAERVVKSMPKWIPGTQAGKAVRVKYFVPVVFKLQ